jgi:hypothetical protein
MVSVPLEIHSRLTRRMSNRQYEDRAGLESYQTPDDRVARDYRGIELPSRTLLFFAIVSTHVKRPTPVPDRHHIGSTSRGLTDGGTNCRGRGALYRLRASPFLVPAFGWKQQQPLGPCLAGPGSTKLVMYDQLARICRRIDWSVEMIASKNDGHSRPEAS